ncbi:MAG: SRPBCC family protein [Halolamina sp.]
MERLIVDTVVYRPVEVVYDFLLDFPRYAHYSEYLDSVRELRAGADEQARYALRFSWWKLSYTARSAVTDTVPNERIEWTLIDDFEAGGRWLVDERDLPAEAPDWAEAAATVRFEAAWNPDSVDSGLVDLPRLVSIEWVIDKVKPIVDMEAERVVQRAVEDLEGQQREVDLTVRTEHVE